MRVILTSEFTLEDGVEFQTHLYTEDARIFKFTIPQSIPDDTSLLIKASAFKGTVHDFTLAVAPAKPREEDSGTTHEVGSGIDDKRGIPAWKKGQVIRLNKENFPRGWCKGCEIKVLLDVKDEGYYRIMAQTTDAEPMLHNGN